MPTPPKTKKVSPKGKKVKTLTPIWIMPVQHRGNYFICDGETIYMAKEITGKYEKLTKLNFNV